MGNYSKEIHFGGKVLVIWGNNATLDAAGKGRFFATGDGGNGIKTSLELHGLVMQNGKAGDYVSFLFVVCCIVLLCPSFFKIRSKYEMSLKCL